MKLRMQTLDTQLKFMSYLKIFPRALVVKNNGLGAYVGQIIYDFEQYGRILYDNEADVVLEYRLLVACSEWSIRLNGTESSLVGLSVFMHAMNFYLFKVLQFDPVSHWSNLSNRGYQFYFEKIHFDMGARQFISTKDMRVISSGYDAQSFLKEENAKSM